MQDLCHATRYICTSSNPTEGILIKFSTLKFWGCFFSCAFLLLLRAVCLFFVLIFFIVFPGCVVFCCFFDIFIFVLNFNHNRQNINITMKFQDASCPPLAVSVLSSSVEPPS